MRAYFDRNRELFARPATVDVKRVVFRPRAEGDDAAARAGAGVELLRAGATSDYVRRAHGDESIVAMPAGRLLL